MAHPSGRASGAAPARHRRSHISDATRVGEALRMSCACTPHARVHHWSVRYASCARAAWTSSGHCGMPHRLSQDQARLRRRTVAASWRPMVEDQYRRLFGNCRPEKGATEVEEPRLRLYAILHRVNHVGFRPEARMPASTPPLEDAFRPFVAHGPPSVTACTNVFGEDVDAKAIARIPGETRRLSRPRAWLGGCVQRRPKAGRRPLAG